MKLLFFIPSAFKQRQWLGSRVADSPDAAIPIDWVQAHALLQAKPASVRQIQEKNRSLCFLDVNEKDLALTESN